MTKNIIKLALVLCLFGNAIFAGQKEETLAGLQAYVSKYNNTLVPLTGKLEGKFLQIDFDFLHPHQEAALEGEDLFIHNWEKNQVMSVLPI